VSVQEIRGGVTSPKGFVTGSATAGLRSKPLPDVALLAVEGAAGSAAAVFTTNRFAAAPIVVARRHLAASKGRIRGVVANAGCANAGTGKDGMQAALRMAAAAAAKLGCQPEEVLPASTGLIGSHLRIDRIEATLPGLALRGGELAGSTAARAIMTTDTRPKQAAAQLELPGGTVTVGGMAKGSGMIHPQMATMLAFLTTDADAAPDLLQAILRDAVERSFNQVSVDGDTSTNDMVVLLASGASGVLVKAGSEAATQLGDAVLAVSRSLAMQIAADGEGARSRIDVTVSGAATDAEARRIARAVAASSLVKSAVHGGDPNWGRIASAAGQVAERLDADRLRICIGEQVVFAGEPVPYDERRASRALKGGIVHLELDLGQGQGHGEAWGCDLSAEYVAINSEYRT
jgi:glutamate N-acetyltransferase/amino-acid N-acetyltransferase